MSTLFFDDDSTCRRTESPPETITRYYPVHSDPVLTQVVMRGGMRTRVGTVVSRQCAPSRLFPPTPPPLHNPLSYLWSYLLTAPLLCAASSTPCPTNEHVQTHDTRLIRPGFACDRRWTPTCTRSYVSIEVTVCVNGWCTSHPIASYPVWVLTYSLTPFLWTCQQNGKCQRTVCQHG